MLAAKMDMLLKRLEEHAVDKEEMKGTIKATGSQMTLRSLWRSQTLRE